MHPRRELVAFIIGFTLCSLVLGWLVWNSSFTQMASACSQCP